MRRGHMTTGWARGHAYQPHQPRLKGGRAGTSARERGPSCEHRRPAGARARTLFHGGECRAADARHRPHAAGRPCGREAPIRVVRSSSRGVWRGTRRCRRQGRRRVRQGRTRAAAGRAGGERKEGAVRRAMPPGAARSARDRWGRWTRGGRRRSSRRAPRTCSAHACATRRRSVERRSRGTRRHASGAAA